MNDWVTWTVISIPTVKWAEKIYPNKTCEDAVQALWETIYNMSRVDKGDPIKEWETHKTTLENASALLNKKPYQALHMQSPGTDITIGLPKNHIWQDGAAVSEDGVVFNPNIPTE